jgi:hypothetical protein
MNSNGQSKQSIYSEDQAKQLFSLNANGMCIYMYIVLNSLLAG